MTLTTILPTLRASIPDPIDLPRWPAGTRVTVSDLMIDDVSVSSLAAQRGTPLFLDAGVDAGVGLVAVRVVAVVEVDPSMPSYARPELILDVDPGRAGAQWDVVRMIGRVSTAKVGTYAIAGRAPVVVDLPVDIRADDMLVAPR